MPLYDYCCEQGHVTELRQGIGVASIPCPKCGRKAHRVPVYAEQYIRGETVAKGAPRASQGSENQPQVSGLNAWRRKGKRHNEGQGKATAQPSAGR